MSAARHSIHLADGDVLVKIPHCAAACEAARAVLRAAGWRWTGKCWWRVVNSVGVRATAEAGLVDVKARLTSAEARAFATLADDDARRRAAWVDEMVPKAEALIAALETAPERGEP